jgi:hypothetical protein
MASHIRGFTAMMGDTPATLEAEAGEDAGAGPGALIKVSDDSSDNSEEGADDGAHGSGSGHGNGARGASGAGTSSGRSRRKHVPPVDGVEKPEPTRASAFSTQYGGDVMATGHMQRESPQYTLSDLVNRQSSDDEQGKRSASPDSNRGSGGSGASGSRSGSGSGRRTARRNNSPDPFDGGLWLQPLAADSSRVMLVRGSAA